MIACVHIPFNYGVDLLQVSKIKAQLGSQRTMLREEQKVEIASLQENVGLKK